MRTGEAREAADMLRASIEHSPGNSTLWYHLALAQKDLEEAEAAHFSLERAWELDRENRGGIATRALTELSRLALAQNNAKSAIDYAKRATQIDPKDRDAWYARARGEIAGNDRIEARVSLRKALQIDPTLRASTGSYRGARGSRRSVELKHRRVC